MDEQVKKVGFSVLRGMSVASALIIGGCLVRDAHSEANPAPDVESSRTSNYLHSSKGMEVGTDSQTYEQTVQRDLEIGLALAGKARKAATDEVRKRIRHRDAVKKLVAQQEKDDLYMASSKSMVVRPSKKISDAEILSRELKKATEALDKARAQLVQLVLAEDDARRALENRRDGKQQVQSDRYLRSSKSAKIRR